MFRKLTRIKQAITLSECEKVLKTTLRGVLAVNGEDGYPYAIPMNHYYDADGKTIYFHSGKIGCKVDCITRSDKACFTVSNDGERLNGEWWLTFKSVVVFGRIAPVTDEKTVLEVSRALSHKFTEDEAYIDREIEKYAPATLLLALRIEDMQGKTVREK